MYSMVKFSSCCTVSNSLSRTTFPAGRIILVLHSNQSPYSIQDLRLDRFLPRLLQKHLQHEQEREEDVEPVANRPVLVHVQRLVQKRHQKAVDDDAGEDEVVPTRVLADPHARLANGVVPVEQEQRVRVIVQVPVARKSRGRERSGVTDASVVFRDRRCAEKKRECAFSLSFVSFRPRRLGVFRASPRLNGGDRDAATRFARTRASPSGCLWRRISDARLERARVVATRVRRCARTSHFRIPSDRPFGVEKNGLPLARHTSRGRTSS